MADLVERNTGAGASQGEARLLDVVSIFDDAYFNQDTEALKALLSTDVVLHADHIVTEAERKGPDSVASFFGKFFDNYHFKHFPVVRAVNVDTRSCYCLWDDEDVLMRPEKFDEELPASGSVTSLSGIWRLVLDEEFRVAHIWFLRQLTREEKKHRLKHRPSQLYCDFHAKSLVGPTLDLSEKQVSKMHEAAEAFNEAWRTGDVSSVHAAMSPSAHSINPIFGEKKSSRDEWEEMIHEVFKVWEVKDNSVDVAVTPSSNKAFLFWHARGVQKDTQQENDIYGLNLLVFDPKEMLISEIVGFRQPMQSEHDHVFKAGSYLEFKEKAEQGASAGGKAAKRKGTQDEQTQTEGNAAVEP